MGSLASASSTRSESIDLSIFYFSLNAAIFFTSLPPQTFAELSPSATGECQASMCNNAVSICWLYL